MHSPSNELFDFVMDYEDGLLSDAAIIEGFQKLLDAGVVWHLQGHYGRTARALIDAGLITEKTS